MLKPKINYPLAPLTTLKIGGPAQYFCTVKTVVQLKKAIQFANDKNLPFLIIGGGSNLLISDQGFPGLVIQNKIKNVVGLKRMVKVGSGLKLQSLIDLTINQGLSGMQKLSGIPGTVGGAIYGNAGAYGQTISDYLVKVVALDVTENKIISLSKQQCLFGYRQSIFKKHPWLILEANFKLPLGNIKELKSEKRSTLLLRNKKYPKSIKCPGSFYKNIIADTLNPDSLKLIPKEKILYGKIPAGYLLEEVGARGEKLGAIEVCPYHGNLFTNTGKGTAADFYKLAKEQAEKVKVKFNITLEPEVQLINLPPIN